MKHLLSHFCGNKIYIKYKNELHAEVVAAEAMSDLQSVLQFFFLLLQCSTMFYFAGLYIYMYRTVVELLLSLSMWC